VIGLGGEASWRLGWLASPLVAAVAAGVAVARGGPATPPSASTGGGIRSALGDRTIARWALGEILANSAWIGVLVYAGALFVESYGTSTALTGVLLALAAASFIAGNLTFRRVAGGELVRPLVALALGMAFLVTLFGVVRPSVAASAILLAAAAFLGGARTLLGNAYGLHTAPERRIAVMATRAAANQFGYFVGSAVAGVAIAAFGYPGLGVVLGLLFVAAALSLIDIRRAGLRLSLFRRSRQGEPEVGLS
jgi:predicted MFS family arabinose efflux permease